MDSVAATNQKRQMADTQPADAISTALARSRAAQAIAQMLFSQHCIEDGLRLVRLEDVDRKEAQPFLEAGEFVVQMVLCRTLERTALMAAADLICQGNYGEENELQIGELSRKTQAFYFKIAEAAIRGYKQTLAFQSPDAGLDRRYDDLLQVLEIDGLV